MQRVRNAVIVLGVVAVVLNVGWADSDVSAQKPFSDFVGRQYRIVGDVNAYGVKRDLSDETTSYVTVRALDTVGMAGPEVTFTTRLAPGTTFRITRARKSVGLYQEGIRYLVSMDHPDIPAGLDVELSLLGGNESPNGALNPRFYELVPDR